MAMTDEQIVKSVLRAMKYEGFSRRSLAKEMGWQLTTLRRRLGGGVPFTVGEIAEVAAPLDANWRDFVIEAGWGYELSESAAPKLHDIPVVHVTRVLEAIR